jgi:hypothetical protein
MGIDCLSLSSMQKTMASDCVRIPDSGRNRFASIVNSNPTRGLVWNPDLTEVSLYSWNCTYGPSGEVKVILASIQPGQTNPQGIDEIHSNLLNSSVSRFRYFETEEFRQTNSCKKHIN